MYGGFSNPNAPKNPRYQNRQYQPNQPQQHQQHQQYRPPGPPGPPQQPQQPQQQAPTEDDNKGIFNLFTFFNLRKNINLYIYYIVCITKTIHSNY